MQSVVIGFLGVKLDVGKNRRWKPTLSLVEHDEFHVDRLELLYDFKFNRLAHAVKREIEAASPDTEVVLNRLDLSDPWDFEEVYAKLFDFARGYGFDEDRERYHIHLTTGTHVAQICWFLLAESRHVPALLLQTGPPLHEDELAKLDIIDLDLRRYNALQHRFDLIAQEYSDLLKGGIETRNAAYNGLISQIEHVAGATRAPILLLGETGTGKEMIARACHQSSRRSEGAFLALNCASLPDSVAETELFGYAAGAFNQPNGKAGLLEQAKGGTLLLDEIADMSSQLQAKLLRVLEDGEFRRVGDAEPVKVDVRFICTTCRDLGQLVEEGRFRKELYYRLNVLSLVMPSLKDRRQDIVPLAEAFIVQHSTKLGRRPAKLSKSCVDFLQQYPWPGNVRQLQNALYRALSLLDGKEITKEDIQLPSCAPSVTYIDENFDGTLDEEVKKFEKDLLKRLYPFYPSTRQLAKKLGLSHTAIANKLREYGINKATVKL